MRRIGLVLMACLVLAQARAEDTPARKFVVFFQQWSAALNANALKVIGQASDFAKAHPDKIVHVHAFADPTGSHKANTLLSELRAQVVMDQLGKDGMPDTRVIGRGHGPVQFALTAQESRRVEISIDEQ
jgi:outer membrane protein OmpA-like peptidoglycan-associated protein